MMQAVCLSYNPLSVGSKHLSGEISDKIVSIFTFPTVPRSFYSSYFNATVAANNFQQTIIILYIHTISRYNSEWVNSD